ncbi:alginate lyase family protein [Pseudodesulfovibrio sp.]|uniref:alginate lyase family protein n=1 Tax=unclassified Pseudodesulfovibrio TaxID=2661612 RepID=UPI003B00FBDD
MTLSPLPVILLMALLLPLPAHAAPPNTITLSPEVLAGTKQRYIERDPAIMPAVEALLKDADRCVTAPAEAVVLKPGPPPGGTMHDYWSLAPEWWPDPTRLRGSPYIYKKGTRNPEVDSDRFDRGRMRRMARDALTLALAWYLTGNDQYAGKGCALVWSWCCDELTRTNPNLKYGRSRPGVANGSGDGIIETRDLIRVADAGRILSGSSLWSKVETRKLAQWFKAYASWLQLSDIGQEAAAFPDHRSTWHDAQLAVFALFAGDRHLARSIVEKVRQRCIIPQINQDGTMPEELKHDHSRNDTFSNLQALFVLASVGERMGIDLWRAETPDSGSIRAALDRAAPYIDPDKEWPFGRSGQFDPFRYTPLFHRAALVYKDARYLDHLKTLPRTGLRTDRALLFY